MRSPAWFVAVSFTFIVAMAGGPAHGANVALDKPVTLVGGFGFNGAFCGSPPPAPAQTLTDGVFVPEGTCWQIDTVWWDANHEPSLNNSIIIDLQGNHDLTRFVVQADNNDTYRIEYRVGSGEWMTAWDVPSVCCYGMTTRQTRLSDGVTASALRFTATGGDNVYSVSEIQAFSVPEPTTWLLLTAGLAALALRRRSWSWARLRRRQPSAGSSPPSLRAWPA